jgi:alkylation response protein AidB-like acyl-CoA dehydrogenase
MEFGLSQEQRLFDESLRGFLADRLPLDRIRAVAQEGGIDEELWGGLAALGIPGLLVPERFGGAGLGVVDAAVAAEALGHAVAPVPFAAGVVMATLAFLHAGSEAQQQHWLPRLAKGELRLGVAAGAVAGQTGTAALRLERERLSGRVTGALDAAGASHLLVYLADGGALLVEAASASATPHPPLDRTRSLIDLAFDGAPVERLRAANDPKAAALRVLDAGRVMLAADTLGAAQRMLDRAVDYAKERVQFGRVIGSFQGVKHTLADMVTMLEPCRGLVWYAAHAQDAIPEEARLAACHAKAHVGDVCREVARLATEVHGGMGFTDLLGLHFWFKRISFNRQILGAPERCREEAAGLQGWGNS